MKVSVILPFHNAARTLDRAVLSVFEQDFVGEIILIDDASTDRSLEIAKDLCLNSNLPSTILIQPIRSGPGAARNKGIAKARCPLIAFLDADDFYLPNRFRKSVNLLEKLPKALLVYGATKNQFESNEYKTRYKEIYGSEIDSIYLDLKNGQRTFNGLWQGKSGYIHLNAITMRTSAAMEISGFDESLRQCQDTDFIFRLSLNNEFTPLGAEEFLAVRNIDGYNSIFNRKVTNKYRVLFLRKWIKFSLWQAKDIWASTHFTRAYLAEHHTISGKPINKLQRLAKKLVLLSKLIIGHRETI